MKPGWITSELSVAGTLGVGIYQLAEGGAATIGDGILRGCACLALAWIAGKYAHARAEVKRGRSA